MGDAVGAGTVIVVADTVIVGIGITRRRRQSGGGESVCLRARGMVVVVVVAAAAAAAGSRVVVAVGRISGIGREIVLWT